MRLTRIAPSLLAVVLAAGACTSDDATSRTSTDIDSATIALTSGLTTPGTCDGLLSLLIAEGIERVGPYGFDQGYYWLEGDDVAVEEAAADSDTSTGSTDALANPVAGGETEQAEDGTDFSSTNNQESGVDEPDLVKTDGNRLVVITNNTLSVIDTTTNRPELQTTIDLPEEAWATEMFLVGDRAYVMVQGWTEIGFGPAEATRYGGASTTQLIEVDLLTGKTGGSIEFEGNYLSAREIDGVIRFVTSTGMGNFPFVFPSNPSAEEGAETANRAIVEKSTIDQWLPSYRRLDGSGAVIEEGRLVDCNRMHVPADFSGFGAISVLTIDTDAGLDPVDALGVVTDGNTIYASIDRLTVATARWPEFDRLGNPVDDAEYSTALHSFDISEPASTSYMGSGAVPGTLLSQYSLSEHEGYLRAATTAGNPWGGEQTESMVTILQEQDGVLAQVGQVGGLGKGEQIFAVRFMGDVGYVVTFRQVDPLYVVDLSDPNNPQVAGELKIPGFSTYLHPIGEGTLVGVGQDATDVGTTTGSQISTFDVSDMSNPVRIDQLGLGTDTYSAVDWDPRAFTWWGSERLAFVPISWWAWDEADNTEESGTAAVAVSVAPDGTLTELGRIRHPATRQCESDFLEEELAAEEEAASESGQDAEAELVEPSETSRPVEEDYCWSYQPEIRRSVVIGDLVYTISEAGVKANNLSDLSEVVWLPLGE